MTRRLEARGLRLAARLEETDLAIEGAALVCLVGPNGSGKTSLLHALAGIGSPQGEVRIDGLDPARLGPDERRRLLAYLPAAREAAWPISARDAIALGLPAGAPAGTIAAMMETLELTALAERRIDRLSTGERSRVLIARALAPQPRLLLLDEPVANLDPLWQLRLMDHLRTRVRDHGQAVLLAIHDLDLAARHADRLIVMDGGRIAADGDPAALLAGPHIPAVFGIERRGDAWRPLSRPADPRSSR